MIYVTETWKDKYDTDCLCWDDNFMEHSTLANREFKTGRSSEGISMFIKGESQTYGKIE